MEMAMSIKVRYFAGLKESLGRCEDDLDGADGQTAQAIWARLNEGRPLPSNILVAINMDYASLDAVVGDGDELAFFPPVTGGQR